MAKRRVFEGEVKGNDDIIAVIGPESETFIAWLEKHRKDYENKKVRITVEITGKKVS